MTTCQEFCQSASHCAPCEALDDSFRRIDATRRAFTEGSNRDGSVWAEYAGRMLHGTRRDD